MAARDVSIDPRTAQDSAELATVTADDVQRARRSALTLCTPLYRRYLAAVLDPRELEPPANIP